MSWYSHLSRGKLLGQTSDTRSPLPASSGKPLAPEIQDRFEPCFGVDLSQVRIHSDGQASADAAARRAQAITEGAHVRFAPGRYAPGTADGDLLLAHELAHVVQQARGGASTDAEARADGAAARVVRGQAIDAGSLGGAAVGPQAKPDPSAPSPAAAPPAAGVAPGRGFSKNLDAFAHNSAQLTGAHQKMVEEIRSGVAISASIYLRGVRASIRVTGHTDTSGEAGPNEDLGLQRANAVKAALESSFAAQKGGKIQLDPIAAASRGEGDLARPTKDGVKEPANRRVVVDITIEPIAAPAPKKDVDLNLPPDYVPPPGPPVPKPDPWRDMNEKLKPLEKEPPKPARSAQDVVIDAILENVVDPLLKRLPGSTKMKKLARDGIRSGLEAGSEKMCEAAIDRAGATGPEAEALKEACKAALQTKPGELGPPGPSR